MGLQMFQCMCFFYVKFHSYGLVLVKYLQFYCLVFGVKTILVFSPVHNL